MYILLACTVNLLRNSDLKLPLGLPRCLDQGSSSQRSNCFASVQDSSTSVAMAVLWSRELCHSVLELWTLCVKSQKYGRVVTSGTYQWTAMTVFTGTCIVRHWPRASLNMKDCFVSRDIVYRISLRLFTHFIINQPTYRHMENDIIMNLKEILVRIWHGFNWLRIGSNGGLIFNTIINVRVL